jgi:hypothetical protein
VGSTYGGLAECAASGSPLLFAVLDRDIGGSVDFIRLVQIAEALCCFADQARNFYTRYQFEPAPTDPLHLMLLIKDAKASVPALQEGRDTARCELTEAMVATGADGDHLESLTNEQFRRLMAAIALTHADDEVRDAVEGYD